MKNKVSLNLSKLSGPEKIEKGRHMVTSMTGNVNFTTPVPALVTVTNTINAFEAAYNAAQNGGKVLTAIMHDKEDAMDGVLTQMGHYVEATANGQESVILSAGMNVKAKSIRKAKGFAAKSGKQSGDVLLQTKSEYRTVFIFEKTGNVLTDGSDAPNATGWEEAGISLKASITLSGLTVGQKYWFRYATVNKNGQSAWSDPISFLVSFLN